MSDDPFAQLRIVDEPVRARPPLRRPPAGAGRRRARSCHTVQPSREEPDRDRHRRPPRPPTNLTPYICVSPAVDALAWYADVLGAVETIRYTGDDGRIGHAEISIGGAQIMLSDEYPELGVRRPDDARRHADHAAPRRCPTSTPPTSGSSPPAVSPPAPPRDEAYGARSFSMLDPFGHRWMIQTPIGIAEHRGDPGAVRRLHDHRAGEHRHGPVVELGYFTLALPDTAAGSRFYGDLFGWATEPGNAGDEYAHVANTKLPLGTDAGAGRMRRRCCTSASTTSPPTPLACAARRRGHHRDVVRVRPQRRLPRRPGPRVPALATRPRLRVAVSPHPSVSGHPSVGCADAERPTLRWTHASRRAASSAAPASCSVPALNASSSSGPMPWSPIAPWR